VQPPIRGPDRRGDVYRQPKGHALTGQYERERDTRPLGVPTIVVGPDARPPIRCGHVALGHEASERAAAAAFNQLVIPPPGTEGRRVIIILMGVSGSGKTTIGRLLAARLSWAFLDADDFHSAANVARMQEGKPLNDEDRRQWLADLRSAIAAHLAKDVSAVMACSALRADYRRVLGQPGETVHWVYLHGDFAMIHERIAGRRDHYMPASLLETQFATLEEPADALKVSVSASPPDVVTSIVTELFPLPPDS